MSLPGRERLATSPKDSRDEIRRIKANLRDELDGIALYRMMSDAEPVLARRQIFEQLAQVESRHAEIWRRKLLEAGVQLKEHKPGMRVRLAGWIAHRFGVQAAL